MKNNFINIFRNYNLTNKDKWTKHKSCMYIYYVINTINSSEGIYAYEESSAVVHENSFFKDKRWDINGILIRYEIIK